MLEEEALTLGHCQWGIMGLYGKLGISGKPAGKLLLEEPAFGSYFYHRCNEIKLYHYYYQLNK